MRAGRPWPDPSRIMRRVSDSGAGMDSSIVFIGGGNMATSLVSGLRSADCPGERITIVEPDADKRRQLADDHGVRTVAEADAEVLGADAVILAVKPQLLPAVCADLATRLADRRPLIISIAAGVPLSGTDWWPGKPGTGF